MALVKKPIARLSESTHATGSRAPASAHSRSRLALWSWSCLPASVPLRSLPPLQSSAAAILFSPLQFPFSPFPLFGLSRLSAFAPHFFLGPPEEWLQTAVPTAYRCSAAAAPAVPPTCPYNHSIALSPAHHRHQTRTHHHLPSRHSHHWPCVSHPHPSIHPYAFPSTVHSFVSLAQPYAFRPCCATLTIERLDPITASTHPCC